MRIAMISPLWGPAYPTGSGIYAYELAKRMAEQGHEVHAFTSQIGNFNGMLLPKNLHLRVLRTYSMLWDMNPIANVLPILLREDFDVVHVHSYIFYMSNSTAAARLLKDFRYVLNFHGGISHSAIQDSCSRRLWIKDNVYDRTLGRATVALADKVLSVSKADIPLIRRAFGVDAQYIPNAVSIEDFKPGEKGAQRITYVGKLEKWKGVETLLEIFRQVRHEIRDAEFQIIGDGSLADKMRKADLPIIMRGHIPHENMPAQYRDSAVSVLPSFMEGAPTTCMESLACGVPCVATRVGDTPEIVKDGHSGFLVEPGDVSESASHIVELMENDSLRRRMGAEGREHMVNHYSYEAVVERMLKAYEET
ncbi:MAG: glycosyltransferase family 4 protein [Euryarchaeota archaeon]|nr:glycosyltransferase family 4 protein [Euryarchaeota archaeon]